MEARTAGHRKSRCVWHLGWYTDTLFADKLVIACKIDLSNLHEFTWADVGPDEDLGWSATNPPMTTSTENDGSYFLRWHLESGALRFRWPDAPWGWCIYLHLPPKLPKFRYINRPYMTLSIWDEKKGCEQKNSNKKTTAGSWSRQTKNMSPAMWLGSVGGVDVHLLGRWMWRSHALAPMSMGNPWQNVSTYICGWVFRTSLINQRMMFPLKIVSIPRKSRISGPEKRHTTVERKTGCGCCPISVGRHGVPPSFPKPIRESLKLHGRKLKKRQWRKTGLKNRSMSCQCQYKHHLEICLNWCQCLFFFSNKLKLCLVVCFFEYAPFFPNVESVWSPHFFSQTSQQPPWRFGVMDGALRCLDVPSEDVQGGDGCRPLACLPLWSQVLACCLASWWGSGVNLRRPYWGYVSLGG